MRTKVTLVLLFLNVALFFFIFKFERQWRTKDQLLEARRRVLGAEAADIRTLEISNGTTSSLSLAKRGDTWFITKPIEWPANPNAVKGIINELQFLEHEASFNVADLAKNGQSLADYGLDHPKLTVSFGAGEKSLGEPSHAAVLRIGDTTKDGRLLYLLSPDGERIHVVSQSLMRSLGLTFNDLLADSVFTIPVFEAQSLNLQTAAPANLRIRLRRYGNRWSFETPIIARASKNATELAINSLNALHVQSFVTQNPPATLPSANPRLRVNLEGNNRRETLLLGDPAPAGTVVTAADVEADYAQLENRDALFIVAVPKSLRATLDNAQDALRETRILDFDSQAVTAITLSAPNQPELTLQRLETGARDADAPAWHIVRTGGTAQGPQTAPADTEAVQRLLNQLASLSAKQFKSDAPRDADLETWGFNRPEREITLTLPGANRVVLQVGLPTPPDGFAYARVPATSPSVYAIDREILDDTKVAPIAWRDRLLRELPAGARITAVTFTDINDAKPIYSHTLAPNETWDAVLAKEAPGRRTALQAILDQMRKLRAKEFVLDQYVDRVNVAGAERPWKYRLDVTITLVGGAGEQTSTKSLQLTERVGGDRQLAGSAEFNAVFLIEQPLLDALWTLTEGPRDPGPPPPLPAK